MKTWRNNDKEIMILPDVIGFRNFNRDGNYTGDDISPEIFATPKVQ